MPAIKDDIVRAIRAHEVDSQPANPATAAAIKAKHSGARDTGASPRMSYFDTIADAAVLNAEGFALLSAERRLFAVGVAEVLSFAGPLDFSTVTPTVQLVDAEQAVAAKHLIARVEVDLEAQTTSLTLFG